MADRIVSNALHKYLSVFLKNWRKDLLSISLFSGVGSMKNLQINENVIHEILPISFLHVKEATINSLTIKLPSLTRLGSEPLMITIDKIVISLEEPIEPKAYSPDLTNFLLSQKKASSGPQQQQQQYLKKYSLMDRIIDGIQVQINSIEVNIKTLGQFPSKMIGQWSPHIIRVNITDMNLKTTDQFWRDVELKDALPKYDPKVDIISVYRRGICKNISVELIHPMEFYGKVSKDKLPLYAQRVKLIEHLDGRLRLTLRKKARGGKVLHLNAEILCPQLNLILEQKDLEKMIRCLFCIYNASRRTDLKVARDELLKRIDATKTKHGAQIPTSNTTPQNSNLNSSASSTGANNRSTAISKFITKNTRNQSSKSIGEDDLTSLYEVEEDMTDDATDVLMSDEEDEFAIIDEIEAEVKSKLETTSEEIRKVVRFSLNEVKVAVVKNSDDIGSESNSSEVFGYLLEVLGFDLGFVVTEEEPLEKNLQISIPFIQFKQLSKFSYLMLKKSLRREKISTDEKLELEEEEKRDYIFKPNFKKLSDMDMLRVIKDESSSEHYTIDLPVWPQFHTTNKNYPEITQDEVLYKNIDYSRKKSFEKGKELFRMKITLFPDCWVLESRVNPVKVFMDVGRFIKCVEFLSASTPDLDISPKEEHIIKFKEKQNRTGSKVGNDEAEKEQKGGIKESTQTNEQKNQINPSLKEFSFLVEVREPSMYIPSNSEVKGHEDITQLLKVSTKELIITSDPDIYREKWTDDSLFTETSFPSNKNDDYTSFHSTLWEMLPMKFKFKLSNFCIDLLPSLNSPAQTLMEPVSMNIDLGINDESISNFHKNIPKIVILHHVQEFNIHLNQNQFIMLMELVKSYVDKLPSFSSFFLRNTKSLGTHITKRASMRGEEENESDTTEEQSVEKDETITKNGTPDEEISIESTDTIAENSNETETGISLKEILPVLFFIKMNKVKISLNSSSKDVKELLDENHITINTPLSTICLENLEYLFESHKLSCSFVTKVRLQSIDVYSPNKNEPSSVFLTNYRQNKIIESDYIFSSKSSTKKKRKEKPVIILRYEQPMSDVLGILSDKILKKKIKESLESEITRNATLWADINDIHVGLNVDTAFQILKFLNSKDNLFESSPLEILNKTVSRTYQYVRKKYLVKKDKKNTKGNIASENTKDESIQDEKEEILEKDETESTEVKQNSPQEKTPESEQKDEPTKLKKKRHSFTSTLKSIPFYPLIWKVSVNRFDLFLFGDGPEPYSLGLESNRISIIHQPQRTIKEQKENYVFLSENKSKKDKSSKEEDLSYFGDTSFSTSSSEQYQKSLNSLQKKQSKSYDSKVYEFEIKVVSKQTQIVALQKYDSKVTRELLCNESEVQFGILNDYLQPLSKRGMWLNLKLPQEGITATPNTVYILSKLLRHQIVELKNWIFLIRNFVKKPSINLSVQFDEMKTNLNTAKLATINAIRQYYSIIRDVRKLKIDTKEKDEALESLINDKMKLTGQLAEFQMKISSQQHELSVQEKKLEDKIKSDIDKQKKSEVIIMEGFVRVLTHTNQDWKKVYCYLIGERILCLTAKVRYRTDFNNMDIMQKTKFYELELSRKTETLKTMAPVDENPEPKNVFAIINSEEKKIFICPNTDKELANWMRVIEKCVYEIKERNKQHVREIQTDESFLAELQKAEETEGDEPVKKEEIKVEKTEDNEETANQENELIDNEELLASVLGRQFITIKEEISNAHKLHEILLSKMYDIERYVKRLNEDKEAKLQNAKNILREEYKKNEELEQRKEEIKMLRYHLKNEEGRCKQLERDVKKEKLNNERYKEEHSMLTDALKDNILLMSKEMKKSEDEKKRVVKELQVYKRMQTQQITKVKKIMHLSHKKHDEHTQKYTEDVIENVQMTNEGLKGIVDELSKQLAEKTDEVNRLKNQNIEFRAKLPNSPITTNNKDLPELPPKSSTNSSIPTRRLSGKALPPPPNLSNTKRSITSSSNETSRTSRLNRVNTNTSAFREDMSAHLSNFNTNASAFKEDVKHIGRGVVSKLKEKKIFSKKN